MQERRCKTKACIYLFTILLTLSIAFLPLRSFAGDMEIMVDEMVKQGVITKEQGDQMLKGMEERKVKEQEKAGGEKAKVEGNETEPAWAKNIPDWIKNPPDWIKKIKFSGDLRLRYDYLNREPTAAQEAKGTQDFARNRARFRWRLGAETQIIDGVTVGFGLASVDNSSSGNNPRSNNQTFNGEFSKKFVGINYAYVAYTPTFFPWLTVSGGKLKTNPIYQANSFGIENTWLWDPDLTPEGFAMVLNYPDLLKLDGVSLDVFMNNAFFIIDEFGAGGASPYMLAFQPGFNLKFMKDFNLKAAAAYYEFYNIKHQAALGFQPSPGMTNSFFTSGPLAGKYQFNYNAFVESGELGYMTPFPSIIPYAAVFGEMIKNTDSHDGGWQGGVRLGHPSLKKFGDWQLVYAYRRLERDAWLDNFNDDDFYQGQTNAKGHYIHSAFGLMKHVSVALSYFHANSILAPKQPEDRLFVDLRVTF